MKISERWLREWVPTDRGLDDIAERLTMLGLEVDAVEDAAAALDGVVVGRIESSAPHPDANRLQLCRVIVDPDQDPLQIVCGAPNADVGAIVPVATVGAALPGGIAIKAAELRGQRSEGMLCSATELGFVGDDSGLWQLPSNAAPGTPLNDYLGLPDRILDIDLTPNRGDCLSLRGVAREAAVGLSSALHEPMIAAPESTTDIQRPVHIEAPERCVGYAARCVAGVDPQRVTPVWMRERLRRAGVRSINLPVDIGNHVMLELGQPMHAFDGDKLEGDIRVRLANAGESIVTLDGETVHLAEQTLIIADAAGPVAIAGMIGGLRTAVDGQTRSVVFESACFAPAAIAGQGRRYKIHTDSLHRFERGVDPELYRPALDRATGLLLELGGGSAGPVTNARGVALGLAERRIALRAAHVERLLGQRIEPGAIEDALTRLGVVLEREDEGVWSATPPTWRFDLNIPADLVEEIARVHGYDRLKAGVRRVEMPAVRPETTNASDERLAAVLCNRGYSEAVTYSFVEPGLHAELTGDADALALDNPISDQMIDMRRTLWAGLLPSWAYNVRRQQTSVRLFEQSLRFLPDAEAENGIAQIPTLAGLIAGERHLPHWDNAEQAVDFFDIKGDVEALFVASGLAPVFQAAAHPALHPGRCARIYVNDQAVGWLGQLAPRFTKRYKNKELPYLFEVDSETFQEVSPIRYRPISEQPRVRRDLAVVVSEDTPAGALYAAIEAAGTEALQEIRIFDIFRGAELGQGMKSVALSLIFQHKASTLSVDNIDDLISRVVSSLDDQCGASIRGI